MSLPCDIIRDLLPLYHDGVCSEESGRLVREHLAGCGPCRAALEVMDECLAPPPPPADEAAPLKAVAKALEKKRRKVMWRSILAAVLILAIGIGGYVLAMSISLPVNSKKLSVIECVQLSDGRLVLRFESSDSRCISHVSWGKNEDGVIYVTPHVQLLGQRVNESLGIDNFDDYIAIRLTQDGQTAKAVRLGTEKDFILVWRSGMTLPAAGAAVEAIIAGQDAALTPPNTWNFFSYPSAELPPAAEYAIQYE